MIVALLYGTKGVRQMKSCKCIPKKWLYTYAHTVGSSSNASSSDDEIKEAFEGYSCLCRCSYSPSYSWTLLNDNKADQAFMWNPDPFVTNRPVKVAPVGHKKPKFFAQMSGSRSERPHLDFNKMQQSKRLIMVSSGFCFSREPTHLADYLSGDHHSTARLHCRAVQC